MVAILTTQYCHSNEVAGWAVLVGIVETDYAQDQLHSSRAPDD